MEKEPKEKEINVAINLFSGFGQNPDFFFLLLRAKETRSFCSEKKTETPKHVPETEKCFRKKRGHYLSWAARKLDLVLYKISSKDLTYAGFDLLN